MSPVEELQWLERLPVGELVAMVRNRNEWLKDARTREHFLNEALKKRNAEKRQLSHELRLLRRLTFAKP